MSAIVKITDVTGVREYKTLKGYDLSPVFHPAVAEYHDFLLDADYEKAKSFFVSSEATEKVIENVQVLIVALNNGVLPDDLTVLPVDLYNELDKEVYGDLFLADVLPPEGSQKRVMYNIKFKKFQEKVTFYLSDRFFLPTNIVLKFWDLDYNAEYNMGTVFGLNEVSTKKALADGHAVRNIKHATIFPIPVIFAVVGVNVLIPNMAALGFGGFWVGMLNITGVIAGGVIGGLANAFTKFKFENGKTFFKWGYRRNVLENNVQNFNMLLQPYLRSMEEYLKLEGDVIDFEEVMKPYAVSIEAAVAESRKGSSLQGL